MLPKEARLLSNYEFNKVKNISRKHKTQYKGKYLYLSYIKPYGYGGATKFGIVVPNSFSKIAAVRNRAKRRVRELIRLSLEDFKDGFWVVIYPRKEIIEANHEEIVTEFNKILQSTPFSR